MIFESRENEIQKINKIIFDNRIAFNNGNVCKLHTQIYNN
jgi:hypothetical protein